MTTKLSEITTQYRTFVDDQVLTKDQLNEFISYFEDQDRLSRIYLHGVGIVCGFKLKNVSNQSITITQGVGVTTDGDLITLLQPVLESTLQTTQLKELVFKHYRKFEDKFASYSSFKREEGENIFSMDMWELLTEQSDNSYPLESIQSLNDKTILLYLESYAKKGDLCTTIDCDSQGVEQVARLRVLLVSNENAETIAKKDSIFSQHNIFDKVSKLPDVKVTKVLLVERSANVLIGLKQDFYNAILANSTLINLKEGFKSIFEIFGLQDITSKINSWFNFVANDIPSDFQYRYDLLNDLVDTYSEIRSLLLQMNVECCPKVDSFPKHLLLGKIAGNKNFFMLRHRFYESPTKAKANENYHKVLSLLIRATDLVNNYQLPASTGKVKITPSKLSSDLCEKAIPIYYNVTNDMLQNWSYEKTLNLRQSFNLSYHVQNLANDSTVREPLLFNSKDYDFYRIEGQLNRDTKDVMNEILILRNKYRLDFDCIEVDLKKANDLKRIQKMHLSLEHRAGVPKGGTFILISENKKVVADFSLSYRINTENEGSCSPIKECSFPWISSLKYLNNLSRSLKGQKSKNIAIPKDYRLQIFEYRINNHLLVNQVTTVLIPISEIYLRRMHAITEALNQHFPEGLVFDFNETQKRFLITFGANDQYVLRLRDATQNPNSPIYTYSNKGMFKNNLLLRKNAMMCRDILQYNKQFYQKLQSEFAPINKDDDYGIFNDKWQAWYRLGNQLKADYDNRLIRKMTDLPADLQKTVRDIKSTLNRIDSTIILKLDGDWVNGMWVDSNMLDYYRDNKNKTDDPVVKFVNLRKFLHNETGTTKLSLYITNKNYSEDFDTLIKENKSSVDFYFTLPKGQNAIVL